eukprot:gnl/TRDRNA2_/TRDRNA2_182295_c0_seq1.p1 gnl/TRDRNA2_/TRDRNA2_182295_c0~~gnl/TRDRNA2_/TRDRNA2_182295_c0_seq1.p1  ORF type:complete len:378 (-),score=34.06 gnl/TRDRNA2_/TRDRNA2_182295_c0_seq1:121-1254(-)
MAAYGSLSVCLILRATIIQASTSHVDVAGDLCEREVEHSDELSLLQTSFLQRPPVHEPGQEVFGRTENVLDHPEDTEGDKEVAQLSFFQKALWRVGGGLGGHIHPHTPHLPHIGHTVAQSHSHATPAFHHHGPQVGPRHTSAGPHPHISMSEANMQREHFAAPHSSGGHMASGIMAGIAMESLVHGHHHHESHHHVHYVVQDHKRNGTHNSHMNETLNRTNETLNGTNNGTSVQDVRPNILLEHSRDPGGMRPLSHAAQELAERHGQPGGPGIIHVLQNASHMQNSTIAQGSHNRSAQNASNASYHNDEYHHADEHHHEHHHHHREGPRQADEHHHHHHADDHHHHHGDEHGASIKAQFGLGAAFVALIGIGAAGYF